MLQLVSFSLFNLLAYLTASKLITFELHPADTLFYDCVLGDRQNKIYKKFRAFGKYDQDPFRDKDYCWICDWVDVTAFLWEQTD